MSGQIADWMFLLPGRESVAPDQMPAIGFLHVGKTGGSTVRHVVEQVHAVYPGLPKTLILGHKTRLPIVFRDAPHLRVVCTLRDPVERFVSGFYSRLRFGNPMLDIP